MGFQEFTLRRTVRRVAFQTPESSRPHALDVASDHAFMDKQVAWQGMQTVQHDVLYVFSHG